MPSSQIADAKPHNKTCIDSEFLHGEHTTDALRMQATILKARLVYEDYVDNHLYLRPRGNEKTAQLEALRKRHRNTLLSPDFYKVLTIVWKESLPDEILTEAGMERSFEPGMLNAHSLGCELATSPKRVAACVQRVNGIIDVAAAYDLIREVVLHAKRKELRGASRLNEMMVALSSPSPHPD